MISAIIVEDDPLFKEMLVDLLPKSMVEVEILATCNTLRQAKEAINRHNPQLVFLDVELPDGKGIELFQEYEDYGNFETIFVTAYDKYALDAIKRNAADYILKPVKNDELNIALLKVQQRLEAQAALIKIDELNALVKTIDQQNTQDKKISINTNDGTIFIKINDILKLESESNYTVIHLEQNKKIIASKTLSVFEELLDAFNFIRIHRSFIININKILQVLNDNGNYAVLMSDNTLVDISRRKRKDFFDKIAYKG